MFGDQYNYLRIFPFTAKKICHSGISISISISISTLTDQYIKTGEGVTADRKIFKNVLYDDFEKEAILKFKRSLQKYDIQYNSQ